MSKNINKADIAKKMFDEGDEDNLKIDAERSKERTKLREEINRLMIRKFNVQFINLSDIVRRSESQVRVSDFDPEKHDEDKQLLESIRNRGVVTPIMVKEIISDDDDYDSDVKYELIYGHRRTSACKVLGYTTIPAQIVDRRIDSEEITMIENMGVRPLTSYERGREITRYIERTGISGNEFAKQNGFSSSHVLELINSYRSSAEVPDIEMLYQEGKLYSRYIPSIVKLYKKEDDQTRSVLLEKLPNMSQKQIKDLLDFCSIGGSPFDYLQSMDRSHENITASISNSDQKTETTSDAQQNTEKTQQDISSVWDKLEKSRTYAKKAASLYDCQQKDVREAAAACKKANLKPDAIKLVLAARKNGKMADDLLIDTVKDLMENPDTEKIVKRYFDAYEKTMERKSSLLKQFNDFDEEKMELVKTIFK